MGGDTQGVFPCLREERLKAYRKELPSLHSRLTADALYKPLTDTAMLMLYITILMLPIFYICNDMNHGEDNDNE